MITFIEIYNIGKIRSAKVTNPKPGVNEILGKNGQGKSTFLRSIDMVLSGERAVGERPITEGETAGHVIVETDQFKAERRLTKDKGGKVNTKLIVWDKQGNLVSKPQTFLNKLKGNMLCRPIEFVDMSAKERVEILQKSLGINFEKHNAEMARVFEDRRQKKHKREELEIRLQDYADLKLEKSVRTMQEVLDDIGGTEKYFQRERDSKRLQVEERERLSTIERQIQTATDQAAQISIEMSELKSKYQQRKTDVASLKAVLGNMKKTKELLTSQMKQGYIVPAEKINEMEVLKDEMKDVSLQQEIAHRMKTRDSFKSEVTALVKNINYLTESLQEIDATKKDIMRKAKFPVDGMTFGEDDIFYNGIPFSSASTAEKIIMSIAVNLAINSQLKIIMLEEGSWLDDKMTATLEEMATKNKFQIFVELVERSREKNCIVIEDGRING